MANESMERCLKIMSTSTTMERIRHSVLNFIKEKVCSSKNSKRGTKGSTRTCIYPVELLHENVRPHVARLTEDTLLQLNQNFLPRLVFRLAVTPLANFLFRSMQNQGPGYLLNFSVIGHLTYVIRVFCIHEYFISAKYWNTRYS